MNKALLDTDIVSELGRGIDPVVARNAASYRAAFGRYTSSVITVTEVVRGLQRKQHGGRLQAFLAGIAADEILPLDRDAAILAGRIAGDLDRTGQPIGLADPMIAAIAVRHGLELVTGNTAHDRRISLLGYPLAVSNWRA